MNEFDCSLVNEETILCQGQDVRHLIASQPTAREAVRLEAFIPLRENEKCPDDLTYRKLEVCFVSKRFVYYFLLRL